MALSSEKGSYGEPKSSRTLGHSWARYTSSSKGVASTLMLLHLFKKKRFTTRKGVPVGLRYQIHRILDRILEDSSKMVQSRQL